jgi:hypothetical protein
MALHADVHTRTPLAATGWFALSIPATLGFGGAGLFVWSAAGSGWLGALTFLALIALTAVAARRRTPDNVFAFLGGTAATLLGLYAASLIAAELWLKGLGG